MAGSRIDFADARVLGRDAGGLCGAQPVPAQDPQAAVQFQPLHHRSGANARAGRADRVVGERLAVRPPHTRLP